MVARRIFVTVGMGRWPFDRLIAALAPVCAKHDVFAQVGHSVVCPPCDHRGFISSVDFDRELDRADIVITHAGNTVRIAQRSGKVPIAVARQASFGEMGNDHQVRYLEREQFRGRVIAAWDLSRLRDVVEGHDELAARLVAGRPLPTIAGSQQVVDTMNDVCRRLVRRR